MLRQIIHLVQRYFSHCAGLYTTGHYDRVHRKQCSDKSVLPEPSDDIFSLRKYDVLFFSRSRPRNLGVISTGYYMPRILGALWVLSSLGNCRRVFSVQAEKLTELRKPLRIFFATPIHRSRRLLPTCAEKQRQFPMTNHSRAATKALREKWKHAFESCLSRVLMKNLYPLDQ